MHNYLVYSARTNKNLTKVIVPSTRGPYHARFLADNSILTKLDKHVFLN